MAASALVAARLSQPARGKTQVCTYFDKIYNNCKLSGICKQSWNFGPSGRFQGFKKSDVQTQVLTAFSQHDA